MSEWLRELKCKKYNAINKKRSATVKEETSFREECLTCSFDKKYSANIYKVTRHVIHTMMKNAKWNEKKN